MDTLVIYALSLESAEGFRSGLAGFQTKLTQPERGRYQLEITLHGDGEIVALLSALQKYVTERSDGPARLDLDGHRYALHPEPSDAEPSEPQTARAAASANARRPSMGQIGVEPNALDAANAEDRQHVVVLQASEFALDG